MRTPSATLAAKDRARREIVRAPVRARADDDLVDRASLRPRRSGLTLSTVCGHAIWIGLRVDLDVSRRNSRRHRLHELDFGHR
jgi:hypothetical protein